MSNVIVSTKDEYTRQRLEQLGLKRSDWQMQVPRAQWGTNVKVTSTDFDSFQLKDTSTYKIKKQTIEDTLILTDGNEKEYGLVLFDVELDYNILNPRAPSTAYPQEAVVECEHHPKYALKCKNSGTTASTPLDTSGTLNLGDEIIDGSVVWLVELNETWSEYVEKKSPLNYSAIRPLIPGEYEYQDAIVGVQVSSSNEEDRVAIMGSVLHIDVPDVITKGELNLQANNQPVNVKFEDYNKKYYTTPRILTSLVSSNNGNAVIEITSISNTGFTVGLKSLTSPGTYVSGTIDWLAEGY